MKYERSDVEIVGYGGRSIQATLYSISNEQGKLAVVLPGLHYTSSMPLLYYSIKALLMAGISVIDVKTDYAMLSGFQSPNRMDILRTDSLAIGEQVEKLGDFELWGIIGKSLGTLLMALMLDEGTIWDSINTCWMTPLLHQEVVLKALQNQNGRALVIIGTEDPFYDGSIIDDIKLLENIKSLVIEGADHSLEIPSSISDSIGIISDVVEELKSFIGEGYSRNGHNNC